MTLSPWDALSWLLEAPTVLGAQGLRPAKAFVLCQADGYLLGCHRLGHEGNVCKQGVNSSLPK